MSDLPPLQEDRGSAGGRDASSVNDASRGDVASSEPLIDASEREGFAGAGGGRADGSGGASGARVDGAGGASAGGAGGARASDSGSKERDASGEPGGGGGVGGGFSGPDATVEGGGAGQSGTSDASSQGCVPACPTAAACVSGKCVCQSNKALCSNACVDLQTNAQHCGTCTTVCSGGCSAGRCMTTLVTEAAGRPYEFVVDATSLYWSTGTLVKRMPKAGGAVQIIASGQSTAGLLIANATHLYWVNHTEPGAIERWPLAGGTAAAFLQLGEGVPEAFALDANYLYWGNQALASSIMKAPLAGGPAVSVSLGGHDIGQSTFGGMVLDSSNLYFTNTNLLLSLSIGNVTKVPLAGGTATVLASADNLVHLALYGTNLYFDQVDPIDHAIARVAAAGGMVTTLSSVKVQDIAVDATGIYAVTNSQLLRFALSGGDPALLATTNMDDFARVVVDDTRVYWNTVSDGAIHSTAKEP